MRGRWIFCSLSLSVLTFFFGEVWAYIPPSQYVLKGVVQKRAALRTIKTRGTVSAVGPGGVSSGIQFIEEAVFDLENSTLKSFALDEAGRELYSVERNWSKSESSVDLPALVFSVLYDGRTGHLFSMLRKWQIPIQSESELLKLETEEERRNAEKTFLGRRTTSSGLQVSWVLGDSTSNQFWIEKDSFLPSRLILKTNQEADIVFEAFRVVKEVPLVQTLSVKKGTHPILKQEVQDIFMNSPDPSLSKRMVANGFTEHGRTAKNEVRLLLNHFYTLIR